MPRIRSTKPEEATVKVCRHCQKPHPQVYGGKYPRHICPDCAQEKQDARVSRRGVADPSYSVRAIVYAEANGLCAECGTHCRWRKTDRYDCGDDLAEIDHIVPVVSGGTSARANLRLLCKGCNRAKGARA